MRLLVNIVWSVGAKGMAGAKTRGYPIRRRLSSNPGRCDSAASEPPEPITSSPHACRPFKKRRFSGLSARTTMSNRTVYRKV